MSKIKQFFCSHPKLKENIHPEVRGYNIKEYRIECARCGKTKELWVGKVQAIKEWKKTGKANID